MDDTGMEQVLLNSWLTWYCLQGPKLAMDDTGMEQCITQLMVNLVLPTGA